MCVGMCVGVYVGGGGGGGGSVATWLLEKTICSQ